MAFSVKWPLSSRTSSRGTRTPAAAPHGEHNFLTQTSVIISDRTRRANKLGEGSFAKVYRGEYNGKPCAVKVFKEDKVKKELSPDSRGTSEDEMLSKVQHTNIVQMYGMWLDPHKERAAPSIVMELCDESLYDFIRRFKGKIVPKEKKLPILQDIARGMVYLHSQNIVHGDLRSSNVLLCHSEDQTVAKIADFDMARFLDRDTQHHFTTRFTAKEYLPPEVFDHKEHKDQKKKWARLTAKVDVFCFGELVLEMGCGSYPTPTGKFRGRQMLTEQQRREKHLAKLKQSDKESLGLIVRKCLGDAPEDRPSFTEILLEVDSYLHKYGERPDLEVLQDKTAECEALRAEAVKWEDNAKSLGGMQDELEKERAELEKERAELKKEKAEKQDLQIKLQMHQTKVEELQQQIQRAKDAAEESLANSTKLQSELQDTRDDLKEKAELVETKDAQLKVLHGKLVDSEEQMKNEQQRNIAEWNTLQESYRKVVDEKDKLTHELEEVERVKNELKEALSKKTNEHAEAMKKVACLKEALEQKDGNIGELQSKSHEQDKVIQQLNCECLNVQQEVEQLKKERDAFKQKLDDAQTSLKTSKVHTASVEEQLDDFKEKLRTKESANAKLLRTLKDKEGEIKEMKQQKANLESSAKGQDDRITLFKTKVGEMDVQLKREKQEWVSECNALQQQNAELKNQVAQLEETQSSMAATTAQLEQAAATRDKMKTELQHLHEKCDCLEKEHQQTVAKKVEELKSVKREHEREIQALKETHETLNADKDKCLTEKSQDVARLQADVQAKEELVQAIENTALEKEKELDQIKKKLEDSAEHRKTCESERDHLRKEMKVWEKREADLKDSVEKLEKIRTEMERSRMELYTQLKELKAENEATKTQQKTDSEKMSSLQADLQSEKDKVHTMEMALQKDKELDQCRTELKALKATKKHQENALMAELQEKLHQAENVRVRLLEEKEDQKKREAALCDTVKEQEQQHSDLTRKLSECEDQRDSLQREKADLLHWNQQLEVDVQQQAVEREIVLKAEQDYLKQYEDVDRKLHRLSCNHTKIIAQSEKEIQRLKDQLEEGRKEREQLTVQALKQEREKELEKVTDGFAKERQQFQTRIAAGEKRSRFLENKLKEMAAEKDSLDAQLNEQKRALLAAERELTSKMEQTQKELKKMTVIAEKSANEKDKEFQECQQLKEELKTLRERKEQAIRQSEDLRLQNTELQRENENVRKQFLQAQSQLAAQALASEASAHSVNEMMKSVEIAEQRQADQKNTIRRQLVDLQKRLEENKALEERIHELSDKLEKTSKELSSVQKVHAEKEAQLVSLDSAKCQSETELQEKMEQLLLAQKRVDELDERLQSTTTEKEEAMKQVTTTEKHKAQMEEELRNVSTRLEEMTKQRELVQISCKAELDKKCGEAEELQAKCSELKNSLDGMSLSLAALSADKSDLEERLAREEAAKNTLEEEAKKRQAELERLYGSEEANRTTIEELKNQLQEDCEHLNGVIAAQKHVIEGQVTELANCKASMADMRHSMEALSADKKILEERLAKQKRLRDEEVTKLTEECTQLKSTFGAQRQRLLNQLEEKSRLKSEADASNEGLQNQVTTLEGDLQREKDEHANTRQRCEAVEVKLQDTEAELADKITENYVMEDGQLQLLPESKELQEQLALLQDAQSQLLAEKAELQSKLDEAQKEHDSLQCLRDEEVKKITEECTQQKSAFEAAIIEKEAQLTVLQKALEHKMERLLAMDEENRRLRANQMDQKKMKHQRQMLKQGQAEVQKMFQEVKEEKVKLKLEHTSEEQLKKAVETLLTTCQEERFELAQRVERTEEKVLSTLAAANQRNVEAESRQLQSFMSQVKEDFTAHATKLEHTSQEQFKMVMETFRSAHVSKEETTEMVQKLQKAAQDHTSTTSEELAGTVSKTLKSFISQEKKLHALSAAEKGEMLSKVWLLVQDLLRYNLLATFSPSNYLHSDSGQLVLAKKELERVCDTDTISPVCIGDLKAALEALPTALEKFAHTDFQGAVCLAIPYATFTDKVRLCRMCFCHTPAGFDDKGCLHSITVVATAHVVLKPSTSCKLKACAEGLVYSPTWHCGHSEELQSCFTEHKLLPELVPVLQQLELATTIELKKLLGSCSHKLIKYNV